MSYVITKTIHERFVYWWNRDTRRWEGLKNNATHFQNETELKDAVAMIRRLFMFDKSVYCKGIKNIKG